MTTTKSAGGFATKLFYRNTKFNNIISKMQGIDTVSLLNDDKHEELMDLKIFRVCRHYNQSDSKIDFNDEMDDEIVGDIGQMYSIGEIIKMSDSFLSSRIFQIEYDQRRNNRKTSRNENIFGSTVESSMGAFHFVHIKVRFLDQDQNLP